MLVPVVPPLSTPIKAHWPPLSNNSGPPLSPPVVVAAKLVAAVWLPSQPRVLPLPAGLSKPVEKMFVLPAKGRMDRQPWIFAVGVHKTSGGWAMRSRLRLPPVREGA
jgi:hypothetical protein